MRLVISGGGTGGHVFGGVAIAQEFLSQSKANEVLFVGSSQGLEARLVPKAGFNLEVIPIGKLIGQNPLKKIVTLLMIPLAIFKCILILKRFKADLVIGVGGYAAGPCIVAARILQIPVGVLEQNSVVGFTNRVSARLAQHVFTAFDPPPAGLELSKCLATGNPTRSHLRAKPHKIDRPFVVFAFGGSQGASGINKMMIDAVTSLHQNPDLVFIHQTGSKELEQVRAAYARIGARVEVHAFIEDMQKMYDQASIVVCRAGSSTISELAATQNAAIFVPFPAAAGNHQEINARILEKDGAAEVLLQTKSSGSDLANLITTLASNPQKLAKMREKMASFYRPDAAKRIVDLMKTRVLTSQNV